MPSSLEAYALVYNLWHKFSNMAESLTENSIDLLAGMPEENSIPSGEDTSEGMVQAWVSQKLLKHDILRVLKMSD